MLKGVTQEGTSDVAYSRNQLPILEDDEEVAMADAHMMALTRGGVKESHD